MTDVHSKEVRSYNMSRIRGKDTRPELLVRKYLFSKGLRYRLHDKKLPGRPDLVFPKYRKVLFVHGCFWHGHEGCKYFVMPKTRTEWWMDKINRNRDKDNDSLQKLKDSGWGTIVVWECDLKNNKKEEALNSLYQKIIN